MIENIFKTFYKKLPSSNDDIVPVYEGCKMVTCLTPYYMTIMKQSDYVMYEQFDYICSDGSFPLKINKWVGKPKSIRLSFDMSSMAPIVFNDAIKHGEGVYFLGAKPDEIVTMFAGENTKQPIGDSP